MFFRCNKEPIFDLDSILTKPYKENQLRVMVEPILNNQPFKFRVERSNFYGRALFYMTDAKSDQPICIDDLPQGKITTAFNQYGNSTSQSRHISLCPLSFSDEVMLYHIKGYGEVRSNDDDKEILSTMRFWFVYVGTDQNLNDKTLEEKNELIENLIQKNYVRDYVKMYVPENAMTEFYTAKRNIEYKY